MTEKKKRQRSFYSCKEASQILGCNEETIRRMIRRKEVKAKKVGRKWYIRIKDVIGDVEVPNEPSK